jgi:hypothetical protein
MRTLRRIRPLPALLHVDELIAQRCNVSLTKLSRDRFHERVRHPGAGTMRKHITSVRPRRLQQQTGDGRFADNNRSLKQTHALALNRDARKAP